MSDKKSKFWPRIAYSCGTFGHDVFYAIRGTDTRASRRERFRRAATPSAAM